MEDEKAEVKLPCLQVPSAAQQCVFIAIRGRSLQPQLHLLGVVDRMTREPPSLILAALPREETASRG